MAARSPYEILNVSKSAEDVVIHAAYKALMKEYHPDIHSPDGPRRRKAEEISAAFALLKDPERRAAYDQQAQARHAAFPIVPAPPSPVSSGRGTTLAISGWLTALALAAVLFVVWTKQSRAPANGLAAGRATAAEAASPTERDAARIKEELAEMRSMTADYVPPELRLAPPPEPSGTRGPEPSAAPAPEQTDAVAAPVPIPEPRIVRSPSDRPIRPYRARLPQQQQHKRGARTPDEEFMEREGYIY